MPDWLLPALLYSVVPGMIAGLGALITWGHCKALATETIFRQAALALVALVAIGFCFNVPAARTERERRSRLAFRAWSPPFSADGAEVAIDFTPQISGAFRVILRDERAISASAAGQEEMVEGEFLAGDGTTGPLYLSAHEVSWQYGVPPQRVYLATFTARAGTTYHLTVRPSPDLARRLTPSARVVVSPESYTANGLIFKGLTLSGIGTSFWLVGYGVFMAAAIRVALKRWEIRAAE